MLWDIRWVDETGSTNEGRLSSHTPPVETCMVHLGCPVQVSGGQSAEGIVTGLGNQGELLLRLEDQSLLPVTCGDVSVRGVNGYV